MKFENSQQIIKDAKVKSNVVPTLDIKTEHGDEQLDYSRILERLGFTPTVRDCWAVAVETTQVQGWKLHLSSIPVEADRLLALVGPFLRETGTSFKVAKDESVLSQLNEGDLGPTQVGKFITIYPTSDTDARQLAEKLVQMTRGFRGPVVVTDLRLGDIVYARYGGFNPIITRDRFGQVIRSIYTPDGSLNVDSYNVPFVLPASVSNPFLDFVSDPDSYEKTNQSNQSHHSSESSRLFGPGYLVLEIIRQSPKGSVFRGIDLRSQEQVGIKIIKQGRQHCLSDKYGRDMRDRLQRQEVLHKNLYGLVPIPKTDSYFEVKGDGYLPIEYIEGQSIELLAFSILKNGSWGSLTNDEQLKFLSYLEKLLQSVQKMHSAGYIHNDLTASNIWIGNDEEVYLLDLELAHAIDDPTPAFGLGTAGFMSPEQWARKPPTFTNDIYALGCVMILLITGLDPRRVMFVRKKHLTRQLLELTNGAPKQLIEVIRKCVSSSPDNRPNLEMIKNVISNCTAELRKKRLKIPIASNNKFTNMSISNQMQNIIAGGLQGILEDAPHDQTTGLWLSLSLSKSAHGDAINTSGAYEIYRSANRGVAGIVYLLGRLARFGYSMEGVSERIHQAIHWLISNDPVSDNPLPGLHFGEAGVAVAIVEAIAGGLIERDTQVEAFLSRALSGILDWPDITHGVAGQGLAAFYCSDHLKDSEILNFAHRCADYLVDNQMDDGSWKMPPGVDGISGETLTGFAHGVSGIIYFLAEYSRRFRDNRIENSWWKAADWLIEQAISTETRGTLEWSYSNSHKDQWRWWCHGSPGIALTFLRLFEQTRELSFSKIATKALHGHPVDIRYPNLSQCHGLSGLGEIYLEASRVLDDTQWFNRAVNIANVLFHLRRESDNGSLIWLVEDPNIATADLMVGSSGVLHFFLRFMLKGEKIGFPLLLDPIQK